MQIVGAAVDLSGSVVESDGVVAVIAGGSFTSVNSLNKVSSCSCVIKTLFTFKGINKVHYIVTFEKDSQGILKCDF